MLVAKILVSFTLIVTFLHCSLGYNCFGPPVNYIFGSEENYYCPWYRNLIRHTPLKDGCPTSDHYRKYKNCLSDHDCEAGAYCCFSVCQGITRCYNPLKNDFTDQIPTNSTKKLCPLVQPPTCKPAEGELARSLEPQVTKAPLSKSGDEDDLDQSGKMKARNGPYINEDGV